MTKALQQANARKGQLVKVLNSNEQRILDLIGGDKAKATRLINCALIVASEEPTVMACDPRSIARAVMQAAMCDANIAKGTGEGFIVPFKGAATFMDGYKLWVRKLAEAGYQVHAATIGQVEYDDPTRWEYVEVPLLLKHRPDPLKDRGKTMGAYAAAFRVGADGERVLVDAAVLGIAELNKAREGAKKRNGGRESPAWSQWGERMYLRLPLKRLAKKLDLRASAGLQRLLEIDADAPDEPHPMIDDPADLEVTPAGDLDAGRHETFGFPVELAEPEVEHKKDWSNVGPEPFEPSS